MSRRWRISFALLAMAVVAGALYVRALRRRVVRMAESQASEEQARREVVEPPITTPTDVRTKAKLFWISATAADRLEPVEVEMPLSADPVQRSKQVLHELIANPPTPDRRTLPASATLLDFYILPDGTAIADFSDALANETPSGILSEEMAVDSIARTLETNVNRLHRLKILIHGQEAESLAGHVDLTGFFDLNPPSPPPAPQGAPAPAQAPAPGGGLTGSSAPGKLKP
jgi:hypothetical protein